MPLPIRMLISVRKEDGRTDEFSKGIVTLVILLNVAFTVAILYTFLKIGDEPYFPGKRRIRLVTNNTL